MVVDEYSPLICSNSLGGKCLKCTKVPKMPKIDVSLRCVISINAIYYQHKRFAAKIIAYLDIIN